jgi:hypothetical protein
MSLSRRIAESLGMHWHEHPHDEPRCSDYNWCKCGKLITDNPNFSDDAGAVALLRILEKREEWTSFTMTKGWWTVRLQQVDGKMVFKHYINVDLITTPGALAKAWLEFKGDKADGQRNR